MKRVIITSLLFCASLSAQEITLTLEESLALGLKNSKELQIASSQILKSEAIVSEISSSMLPKLSLNASYTKLSDVNPFQVTLPSLPQPITIQESILDNYNLSAKIEQPLFTGFRLSSLKSAAELNNKAESIKYERERITKADNIQQVFWKLYTTQQISKLVEENLSALNSHLKSTTSLLENGLVTKNDLLKLKVEVANIELKLVDAQNNVLLTMALFNKTLGLPLSTKTNIIGVELESDDFDPSFEELSNRALQDRQEIKSTKFQIAALEQKENAASSGWYPQLFAFGDFYYNNPNQRFLPLENEFNDSWDVGLGLKWEVWNWGGTSAKVEQAKQDYLQAENSFALLKENIELDVYNNYLNLQRAIKKIELSKLQVESAEENYRITKQKYYQQLATSTDLIDAETSLLNAKTTQITSKVEYKIGLSALNTAIGTEIK
jgi:outer membrane protein